MAAHAADDPGRRRNASGFRRRPEPGAAGRVGGHRPVRPESPAGPPGPSAAHVHHPLDRLRPAGHHSRAVGVDRTAAIHLRLCFETVIGARSLKPGAIGAPTTEYRRATRPRLAGTVQAPTPDGARRPMCPRTHPDGCGGTPISARVCRHSPDGHTPPFADGTEIVGRPGSAATVVPRGTPGRYAPGRHGRG